MPVQYISTESTVLHPGFQELVLIFGDEVDTTGQQDNGRDEVVYRGRTGWVRSDRLMPNHPLEMYFIDVGLENPDAYESLYGALPNSNGATDGDANQDFDDIQGFARLLETGNAAADRNAFFGVTLPSDNQLGIIAESERTQDQAIAMHPDETLHENAFAKPSSLSRSFPKRPSDAIDDATSNADQLVVVWSDDAEWLGKLRGDGFG